MNKKRTEWTTVAFPTKRDVNGKLLCSVCGKPLTKGLRRYCSQECTDICYVATMPSYARGKVFQRDKGVCSNCGCDTEKLKKILRKARYDDGWASLGWHDIGVIKNEMGFTADHFWEMDHILPVVEGGGLCGMDNLQTLCVPCHRAETKELAARRAAAKRGTPLFT